MGCWRCCQVEKAKRLFVLVLSKHEWPQLCQARLSDRLRFFVSLRHSRNAAILGADLDVREKVLWIGPHLPPQISPH